MSKLLFHLALTACIFASCHRGVEPALYDAPDRHTHTRWVSPENPTGEKGQGGQSNMGAKGNAFYIVPPGAQQVLFDVEGAGIIHRIWMSGTIPRNEEQRRLVRLDMYWDGATKPAVSAPIGDFFGVGLGLTAVHESAYFSNPEAKSFNCAVPMPFRKSAKIVITNESSAYALVWYDINYLQMKRLPKTAMYFHACWNRTPKTDLGVDFEILPKVAGKGRYLGCNVGVVGDSIYQGTWFGEGEVKVFLDGDTKLPTLVGTGTEDYIGTGWGQGEFKGQWQGSTISDSQKDLYAFYRFHGPDPVFFHQNCRVTIQQIGNCYIDKARDLAKKYPDNVKPVWVFNYHNAPDVMRIQGAAPEVYRLLEQTDIPGFFDEKMPAGGVNYYRRDDVSATAYFYLDKPSSGLPPLPGKELRVWVQR